MDLGLHSLDCWHSASSRFSPEPRVCQASGSQPHSWVDVCSMVSSMPGIQAESGWLFLAGALLHLRALLYSGQLVNVALWFISRQD